MLFTRPDAFVCVMTERQCDPWVTVKLGTAASFGLHTRIAKLDPAYAKRKPTGESAVIRHYVTFFRKHARAILAGLPLEPPAPEPPRKPRATRAGALDFLVNELGWGSGSIREFATKRPRSSFTKTRSASRSCSPTANASRARASARETKANLDAAIATLAPDLPRPPKKDQKARLAFYADFFRARGAALLEGKRSAWSRL